MLTEDHINYIKDKLNKDPHFLTNDSTTTKSYIKALASYYNGDKPNIGPAQINALRYAITRLMYSGYSAVQSIDYFNFTFNKWAFRRIYIYIRKKVFFINLSIKKASHFHFA